MLHAMITTVGPAMQSQMFRRRPAGHAGHDETLV